MRENSNNLQHKNLNDMEGIHSDGTDSTGDEQSTNKNQINVESVSVTNFPNGDAQKPNQQKQGLLYQYDTPTHSFNQKGSELESS